MLLAELLEKAEVEPGAWRIHFERLVKGKWQPDFAPSGEEEPLRSREEVERLLAQVSRSMGPRYRNFRVAEDVAPPRHTAGGLVIAYCRVSTAKQDSECAAQVDAITPYIKQRLLTSDYGCEWDGTIWKDSDVSSKIPLSGRPSGYEAVRRLRPGDHFVVARSDRAWGSLSQVCAALDSWHRRGIYAHVVSLGLDTSTFMGRYAIKSLALAKEVELEMVKGRTADKLASNRQRNRPTNQKVKLGYKVVGEKGNLRFVVDRDELALLATMHHWRRNLGYRLCEVVKAIKDSGLAAVSKRNWGCTVTVCNALKTYEGWLRDNDPILGNARPNAVTN